MDPKPGTTPPEQSHSAEPPPAPKKRFRVERIVERFHIVPLEERITPSGTTGTYTWGTYHGHGHH